MLNDLRVNQGFPGLLSKLGEMTAIRDIHLVEQSLLRTLGPLLGVSNTSLYRFDDDGEIMRVLNYTRKVLVHKDNTSETVDNIESIGNEKEISDSIYKLFDAVRQLKKPCTRKEADILQICYPIYGNNELFSYFLFQRDHDVSPVEDGIIQGVLQVFNNYYDLLDSSQRDQLTGLLNRYALDANLDRLWNLLLSRLQVSEDGLSKRVVSPESYWIGVLDIDLFKKINDNYGHIMGDEVLIMVARLLRRTMRQSDLLYRFGGEEFVVIMAANDLESVTQAFERIRRKVEQSVFPQVGKVTISGGFCSADPKVLPREIINRADSALYAAKNAGRNRVLHYDTLVKAGVLHEVSTGSVDLF
jgi:diguanylate cyclase (GGDEF)-like protein